MEAFFNNESSKGRSPMGGGQGARPWEYLGGWTCNPALPTVRPWFVSCFLGHPVISFCNGFVSNRVQQLLWKK